MPVIVVLPGMAALILAPNLSAPDQAYPSMMNLLPVGLKGLVFAALIAAIIASLASKVNSISTIFTLDLYAKIKKDVPEHQLVTVGRISAVAAVFIGILTARPLLGGFDQAFQFIQEFTGFFTPGIVVIFMLGLFWKRASEAGALTAAIGSVVLSAIFWWLQETGQFIFPFMNRVGVVFVVSLVAAVVVSLLIPAKPDAMKIKLDQISYKTSLGFNLAAVGVVAFLILVYSIWW